MIDLDAIRARARAASWWAPTDLDVFDSYGTYPFTEEVMDVLGVRDAVFIAHARTDVPALLAEVGRLRAALSQTAHVIAFDEHGWSIEHLVECRPHMTRCGYHRAAQETATAWGGQPYPTGRYACSLAPDGVLVVGERLP